MAGTRGEYSTLEVNPHHDAPEVVYNPDQNQKEALATGHHLPGQQYPEVAYGQYGSPYQNSYTTPSTMYSATAGGMPANTAYKPYNDGPEVVGPEAAPPPKKKICGVAARTFWILLVIAIIIIAAAVGGGVGGAMASKKKNGETESSGSGSSGNGSNGNGTTSDPNAPKPLGISKIAAANWTASTGVQHRNVYFQDEYNYIIERRWDSSGNAWTTSNISELFAASTTFGPAYGTSLTVAAVDRGGDDGYQIQLYFLDQYNFIRSVYASDPAGQPNDWANNTLDGAYLEVRQGSHLSAMWQQCWNNGCKGSWCVAYQRPSDGAVKTANSSHWTVSDVAVDGADLSNNSSLALIPRLVGGRLSGALLSSTGVASSSAAPMQLSTFTDVWNSGQQSVTFQSAARPSYQNHYASTQFNNWNQSIFLALNDDNTLRGMWGGGQTDKMNLKDAPDGTKLQAISFTLDAHFYGISNGTIQEYTLDQSDPSTLNYVGTIWP